MWLSYLQLQLQLTISALIIAPGAFQDRSYWYEQAKGELYRRLNQRPDFGVAKNLILFVGDGMGLSTVTASRILRGQKQGHPGEETLLAFEKFPYVSLAKTYNVDSQVGDSAACATALMCGVKGRFETLGLDDRAQFEKCSSSFVSSVPCLAEWAQQEGKASGLVTNTRVTHATPAALYAHSASRYWEDDDRQPDDGRQPCKDIARQLVEDDPGRNINVILGGGRRHFLPASGRTSAGQSGGRRKDGRNLVEDWLSDKKRRELAHNYVWTSDQLRKVDPEHTDYLLGLFSSSHMEFETDRDRSGGGEPSLAEMTRKSIEILRKNPRGYFLMVESGRLDHAHHFNNAYRALEETLALEEAVSVALELTNPTNTLLVVTADHSHVFTFGGYPNRGQSILGLDSKLSDVDNMPYTTLLYANGPGYDHSHPLGRQNLTGIDTAHKDYIQQSAVPRRWETHGGEDVPIYALGPMAHLLQGVVEQTYIAHAMAYAACIGHNKEHCARGRRKDPLCESPRAVGDAAVSSAYRSEATASKQHCALVVMVTTFTFYWTTMFRI